MNFWQQIVEPLQTFWEQLKILLPHLVLSLAIVVVGLLLGWLVREILHRVLRSVKFDRLASRLGLATAVERIGGFRSPAYLTAQVAQWLIIVVALLIGLDALDTTLTRGLVSRLLGYLPNLVVAAFVLLLGAIISRFLARGVLLAAVNAGLRGASVVAGLVRFLVMALAAVAALEQLGIGRTTVLLAFAIIFGGVVLALSIAFGLGGRDLARDVLEGQLRKRKSEEREEEGVRHL
jgi:hypothetical protein